MSFTEDRDRGLSTFEMGIIIPTYNRISSLLHCLRCLEAQSDKNFEVIVVDDGSADDTEARLKQFQASTSLRLTCLQQPNAGPARARNHAIKQLSAPLCLMIGDDTFPALDLVEKHLRFHRSVPATDAVAIGLTRWAEQGQVVTPLMRWLDSEGEQFAFRPLLAGATPEWKHFYTSNLSAKTELLKQNPFDETFRIAGFEDIELGYRLFRTHHLRMHFLPDAITEHLHPTTFDQSCRRAVGVGMAAYRFGQIWPEHRQHGPGGLKGLVLQALSEPRLILPAFTALTRLLTRFHCPNPLLPRVLQVHHRLGYQRAAALDHAGGGTASPPA